MRTYLITIGLIFAILAGGIFVQRLYQRFAQRHSELGPFREEESGCGSCSAGSGCSTTSCSTNSK